MESSCPSLIVVLVVVCRFLGGQSRAGACALSLEEAQDRAVAASHRLAEARARAAPAEAAVAVREAADRPIVGTRRRLHAHEPRRLSSSFPGPGGSAASLYPDVPNNYRHAGSICSGRSTTAAGPTRWSAPRGRRPRRRPPTSAAAQADLRLEVARAFWALVTARATVAVLDRSLARAQANVDDVRERLNAGLVPPNEVASAEAQESRQRMLLIETRNQRDLSSAELARLIGEDVLQPIEPAADARAVERRRRLRRCQELVARRASTRDERRALEQRIEAAEEQVRRRRRAAAGPRSRSPAAFDYARPNPRIFPRADRWDESWDAGVCGHLVALGRRPRARRSGPGRTRRRCGARSGSRSSTRCVALEVRQRLLEIDSGRAAVAAADDAVRAATEARRVVAERYQAGVAIADRGARRRRRAAAGGARSHARDRRASGSRRRGSPGRWADERHRSAAAHAPLRRRSSRSTT